MNDISVYYNEEFAKREEAGWTKEKYHERNVSHVKIAIEIFKVNSILEFCCGSGWISSLLPIEIEYTGLDNNSFFLEWAIKRNHINREFIKCDIREYILNRKYDLTICFSAIKHFSLFEQELIISKIITSANFSVIEVQIADELKDDGIDFHHTYITEQFLTDVLTKCNRKEVNRICVHDADGFKVFSIFLEIK